MTISRSVIIPALLASTLALSGCSLLASPEPDPTLVTLLRAATADGRAEDATAIENEIYRLCGTHDDGTTPESCTNPLTSEEGIAPQGDNPAQIILDNIATVPQDSLAVIVPQFTGLAAAGNAIPPMHAADLSEDTNNEVDSDDLASDSDAATRALDHELATKYALGVATSFADGPTRDRINQLIDTHQQRIEALEDTLVSAPNHSQNEDAPLPSGEAAYSLDQYTQPVDQPTTIAFLKELTTDDRDFWESIAASAHSASWRYQSLAVAGTAAQDAVSF